ncbi:MAG: sodium/proton-translocating pyrophosphatase [Planctomycetaceae bacterium]|jgi:Na+/H+-translocating membrane pyrophosphatase|nr:sodium/proton-translocating pyrophosphatase [Planctomycetaceae bacterium]
MKNLVRSFLTIALFSAMAAFSFASEADLKIPDLHAGTFETLGNISAWNLLFGGAIVICLTVFFSLFLFFQVWKLPVHKSMAKVSNIIYTTCCTYLFQQVRFLIALFCIIAATYAIYIFAMPQETHEGVAAASPLHTLIQVLLFAIIGMAGSSLVAWYGIRVNTFANSRTAFAALKARPWDVVNIPLRAGMSVGLFLISIELVMMVIILLFVDRSIVGLCFLGFAIGESLGASALRIAGGIFTKIADIGSDLMKIVFKVGEDDPRNPGVIADCTGDNAGDSIGPTADGFETYGVTGVALISFIVLAITPNMLLTTGQKTFDKWYGNADSRPAALVQYLSEQDKIEPTSIKFAKEYSEKEENVKKHVETLTSESEVPVEKVKKTLYDRYIAADYYAHDLQAKLIVWIFVMRFLMDCLSGCSYFINQAISEKKYGNLKKFDFEEPLTRLIKIAAILCISTSFIMSYLLLNDFPHYAWLKLAGIIACGTIAAVLIPEFTKIFTSSKSKHVQEIVTASREGGPSLNILSGIVAGNFAAFWTGALIAALMAVAYGISLLGLSQILGDHAPIFAFGLVAFGFLCMGPVTIAVDSYGPVTDNAQSIFELSQIESIPGIKEEIKKDYGFEPDFELGKYYLEANDGAGNTFKATAKPVLIGTAVAGATTMIFAIILMLANLGVLELGLTNAPVILGLILGGAVVFWFSGASMQAVTTGAYEAVEFIKKNFDMNKTEANIDDAKTVVKICTKYAQKGMWNIFLALLFLTLAFAFVDPNFFVAYLISIAVFGLFQAMYMANAGGSWDNAKKVVEVDLKEKGTELHAASVIGDTVGDPFKDTSSVALNPIIKFSTLFGLLATEIAIVLKYAEKTKEDITEGVKQIATTASGNPVVSGSYAGFTWVLALAFLAAGLYFVYRSFYNMRIPKKD